MQGTPFFQEETKKMEEYLKRLGYAEETIKHYIHGIKKLFNWLSKEGIKKINQSTLKKYNKYLHNQPIKTRTHARKLYIIKLYDRYQQKTRNKKILTEKLEIETTDLPSTITILSEEEIEKLYKATEETLEGYRLRAILALYYGLGLRRTEGYNLEQEDIDYRRNLIHIKRSKTHTNRYIPMSIRVKKDLKSYQTNVRPHLITTTTQKLLLNKRGTPMQKGIALNQIKHLGKKAGIEKTITLHMLRHSIATHLLKRGMKLEQITQFLGHKSIESTQIYTHIQNGV